jgi:hypothetical protein
LPLEITRPTVSQVAALLAAAEKEAARFLDPPTVGDVTARWGVDLLLFLGTVDGEPAALIGVDSPTFDDAGVPIEGVVQLFILREYRHLSVQLTCLALERAAAWGFHLLATYCLRTNRAACVLARACGFKPATIPAGFDRETRYFVWTAPEKG